MDTLQSKFCQVNLKYLFRWTGKANVNGSWVPASVQSGVSVTILVEFCIQSLCPFGFPPGSQICSHLPKNTLVAQLLIEDLAYTCHMEKFRTQLYFPSMTKTPEICTIWTISKCKKGKKKCLNTVNIQVSGHSSSWSMATDRIDKTLIALKRKVRKRRPVEVLEVQT